MSQQLIKISFIGYGNMAKAIAKSLSHQKKYQLRAASPSLSVGVNSNGIHTHHDNIAILHDADLIVLAVKPQKMEEVLMHINHAIPSKSLVISVAAGLNLSWLQHRISEQQPIIRSMPNIAATINKGATPLIANASVNSTQKEIAEHLFACSGLVTWLENEADIDIFTALSGSGPAYFFLFLEEMVSAAERLGLSKEVAKAFSLQTMVGAAGLAQQSTLDFNELRRKVTSPGGTTAAAIKVFQEHQFDQLLFNAMNAAYNRAKEIGANNA